MNLRWVLLVVAVIGNGGYSLRAQWLTGYAARVGVEVDDTSAGVASAHVYMGGLCRKDGNDIRVVAGSAPVKFIVPSLNPDSRTHVVFATAASQRRYFIYFGNPNEKTSPEAWEPPSGLLMVTYRGGVTSVDQARNLSANAARAYGSSFVEQVFYGYHPFGPPENFSSYFRGPINIPTSGEWTFASTSRDYSQLLLDGKTVVQKPGGGPTGEARFVGKVKLEKGLHRFEYFNTLNGGPPTMVAAWRAPSAKNFETIPATAFPAAGRGKLASFEKQGKSVVAFFDTALKGDVLRGGMQATLVELSFKPLSSGPAPASFEWSFGDGIKTKGRDATVTHAYFGLDSPLATLVIYDAAGKALDSFQRALQILPAMGDPPPDEPQKIAQIATIVQGYSPATMSGNAAQMMLSFLNATNQRAAFIKLLESALASGGQVERFRPQLGDAYFDEKQSEKALEQYRKVVAGGTYADAHTKLRLVECLVRLKQYDDALKAAKDYYERGIKTKPKPIERGTFLNQYTANVKIERYDEATRLFNEYCARNSSVVLDAETYLIRARALQAQRQFEAALTDLEFAEKVEPKSNFLPEILYEQAQCLAALGRGADAGKRLELLKKTYPNSSFAAKTFSTPAARK